MNATHIHLLLNHFPIIGTMIAASILGYGHFVKNLSTQRIAITLLIVMSVFAVIVLQTGEPAEKSIEQLPGVSNAMLEAHEDAATLAFWLLIATSVFGIGALLNAKNKPLLYQRLVSLVLLLSILTTLAMARAGYFGGQIRHTEIRSTNSNVSSPNNGTPAIDTEKNVEENDHNNNDKD